MADKRFNIKEWQDKYLTEGSDFNSAKKAVDKNIAKYKAKGIELDLKSNKSSSDLSNYAYFAYYPVLEFIKNKFFSNYSDTDRSKLKQIQSSLLKHMDYLKPLKGAALNNIKGGMQRQGQYTNGMYEMWFDGFNDIFKIAGWGSLNYERDVASKIKTQKFKRKGSKQSIEKFGK